uniref:hypothetical protein n=1 Tax=uncultured Psychrobacter sp. TaxID=259303 RepID=UPI00259209B7
DKKVAQALTAWHFEGRDARNGLHPTYAQVTAKNTKWRLLSPEESIFHDNGVGKPEKKFIHPDGREAVFDGNCLCAVTDPKYKPTYNYVNPGKKPRGWYDVKGWNDYVHRGIGHGVADVVPYFIGGNDRGED